MLSPKHTSEDKAPLGSDLRAEETRTLAKHGGETTSDADRKRTVFAFLKTHSALRDSHRSLDGLVRALRDIHRSPHMPEDVRSKVECVGTALSDGLSALWFLTQEVESRFVVASPGK